MDTIGGLIDKLITVDMKLWDRQAKVYEIRKQTFEEFMKKYFKSEAGAREFWEALNNATDLNVQRNDLIDEIDKEIVNLMSSIVNGKDVRQYIQLKHKTY